MYVSGGGWGEECFSKELGLVFKASGSLVSKDNVGGGVSPPWFGVSHGCEDAFTFRALEEVVPVLGFGLADCIKK